MDTHLLADWATLFKLSLLPYLSLIMLTSPDKVLRTGDHDFGLETCRQLAMKFNDEIISNCRIVN